MNQLLNLSERLQVRILVILGRVNFIAWSTLVIGIGVIGASGFFYYILQDDPELQIDIALFGLVGVIVLAVGYWMTRQVATLKISSLDLSEIDKKLTLLTLSTLFAGLVISVPLFLLAPVWGSIVIVVYILLLIDIIRLFLLIWGIKNNHKTSNFNARSIFVKIWTLIYPKVKHDNIWHRLISVVGWVVSFFSLFLLFPVYFGIIQRIIYFIIYGDKKDKWLVQE